MSNGGSGRIAAREQRVEWMKGLNLFSNVFMSVALRDTADLCQRNGPLEIRAGGLPGASVLSEPGTL